jgi:hypothetical protein
VPIIAKHVTRDGGIQSSTYFGVFREELHSQAAKNSLLLGGHIPSRYELDSSSNWHLYPLIP